MRQVTPVILALASLMIREMSTAAAFSTSAKESAKRGALIFLHGLGDTPAGWSSLESALPSIRPRLKNIQYVFPHAPTISITINGGMEMPGWFDLFDWPIGVGSRDDRDGLLAGVKQIEEVVSKLEAAGIPSNKIVVGGFSQGGAVALLAAYRGDKRFAGCAGLSSWLTLPEDLTVSDAAKETPLFWGHGKYDDKVLFEQQAFGVAKLKEAGVDVISSDYPMGHESHPDEIEALASFVDEVIFEEKEL